MGSEAFHAEMQAWLATSPVLAALALSALAGIVLTGVGTLSVLAFGQLSEKRSAALLSFAAGAMLYVISEEIIPETHRVGREGMATAMLFTGFLGMMYLDFTLG